MEFSVLRRPVAIASSFSIGAFTDPFGIFNLRSSLPSTTRRCPLKDALIRAYRGPGKRSIFRLASGEIVEYLTNEAPGTIVIDAPNTYLYSFSATAERSAMAVSVVMASPGRHADDHEEGRVAGLDAASR